MFCKDAGFSVSVNLRYLVMCVWCDVVCRFVVVGRRICVVFTEQNDQCGNSAAQSQAPDDGYINVRTMLSIQEVK